MPTPGVRAAEGGKWRERDAAGATARGGIARRYTPEQT